MPYGCTAQPPNSRCENYASIADSGAHPGRKISELSTEIITMIGKELYDKDYLNRLFGFAASHRCLKKNCRVSNEVPKECEAGHEERRKNGLERLQGEAFGRYKAVCFDSHEI